MPSGRPRYNAFMPELIGQQHARDILQAALRSNRMHHAWIFHGPMGVGKFTAARWLAEILLCHQPRLAKSGQTESCGSCPSCKLLRSPDAGHPDLHVITKELAAFSDDKKLRDRKLMSIPIDVLREHMIGGYVGNSYHEPAVGKKPMLNHNKVFIIDEAELLYDSNFATQNTLLKTLEEPPDGTYIILVANEENKLVTTIRSRCQRVPFAPLGEEQVRQWLAARPEAASLQGAELQTLVQFSSGSCGRALLAIEYGLAAWQRELPPMIEQLAAGKPPGELGKRMADLVEIYAGSWVDKHDGASKDAANKAGVRHMLGMLGEICRGKLRTPVSPDPVQAEIQLEPWLRGIELLGRAESLLESNVGIPLLLDHLAIQWSAAPAAPVGR